MIRIDCCGPHLYKPSLVAFFADRRIAPCTASLSMHSTASLLNLLLPASLALVAVVSVAAFWIFRLTPLNKRDIHGPVRVCAWIALLTAVRLLSKQNRLIFLSEFIAGAGRDTHRSDASVVEDKV